MLGEVRLLAAGSPIPVFIKSLFHMRRFIHFSSFNAHFSSSYGRFHFHFSDGKSAFTLLSIFHHAYGIDSSLPVDLKWQTTKSWVLLSLTRLVSVTKGRPPPSVTVHPSGTQVSDSMNLYRTLIVCLALG